MSLNPRKFTPEEGARRAGFASARVPSMATPLVALSTSSKTRVTSLESALQRIAADLVRSGVDFAVAVAGDAEAEALVRRLRACGYQVTALVEQDAVGRLATVRLALADDDGGPVMDLLFASSRIEQVTKESKSDAPSTRYVGTPSKMTRK